MLNRIKVGDISEVTFTVTDKKTVPALYPEFAEFQQIPPVFATGYMVGLMEWCCIRALAPCLETGEGSLGTAIHVSHEAATPVGATVRIRAALKRLEGKRLTWSVEAYDDCDLIGKGEISRTVVRWDRFRQKLEEKRQAVQRKQQVSPA